MSEGFGKGLGQVVGAVVIGVALLAGIVKVGSALVDKVPDVDIPSIPEVMDVVVEPTPYEDISPAVIESIHSLAELTTVEYVEYTTIEKGTDSSWLRWARGDGLQMLAVAEIGAGVDLAELDTSSFDVDPVTGVVSLRMPPAEIFYAALDNEATRVIDRKNGLFTGADSQLETEARRAAEEALLQKALDEGIIVAAQRNAEQVLTTFLEGLGYTSVEVQVVSTGPPLTG